MLLVLPGDRAVSESISALVDGAAADELPPVAILPLESSEPAALAAIQLAASEHAGTPLLVILPAGTPGRRMRRALRLGATGIVTADRLAEALLATVGALRAGQLAIPPAASRQLTPTPLSFRERQVLNLVVAGLTNRQIADALYLSESTVKTHVSSAFQKLDARSRAEAAAIVLDPEEGRGLGVLTVAADGHIAAA